MKNFKLFGIIALAVIIGFSMTACDRRSGNGGGGGGSGGSLTVTGIPSQYDGEYVRVESYVVVGDDLRLGVGNYNSSNGQFTGVRISNGRATLPMWIETGRNSGRFVRYSGNDSVFLMEAYIERENGAQITQRSIRSIQFTNGSATWTWP